MGTRLGWCDGLQKAALGLSHHFATGSKETLGTFLNFSKQWVPSPWKGE